MKKKIVLAFILGCMMSAIESSHQALDEIMATGQLRD